MENKLGLIDTYDDLVDAIHISGCSINTSCLIRRPIFTVLGTLVKVDDIMIQVYEYPDEGSRACDLADAIQMRRFFKGQSSSPEDEIHCWSAGRLNILYNGSERATIRKLINILGPSFLGVSRSQSFLKRERTQLSNK
jgi:hypothetical protein